MRLTPRQFSLFRKRRDAEHQRQELLFGIVAANIVNFSMARPKEPACPADFMPSRVAEHKDDSDEAAMERLHSAIVNPLTLQQGTTRIG